ncbi:MAG: DUF3800 domain-containing protein [Proteobacteria bacterium]|nr:DUF3800 domain-containing protein [Pseudomonadota bacterium]
MAMAETFSDYIVYVDESGTNSLRNINHNYPVFCLAFCVFERQKYSDEVIPALRTLKLRHWDNDKAILHGQEIRRSGSHKLKAELGEVLNQIPFSIIASVIRNDRLKARKEQSGKPDEWALLFCMERLVRWLLQKGEADKTIDIVFESRGKDDDRFELGLYRILNGTHAIPSSYASFRSMRFIPSFVPKADNEIGLQVADLVARPIASHELNSEEDKPDYSAIKDKLIQDSPKVFPAEATTP